MFFRPRRRPSGMQASIMARGLDKIVKVVDISESGARVSFPGGLPEGMNVTLATPRFRVGATVRWTRGDSVGLTLERKLTSGEQTELSGMSVGV